MPCIDPHHEEPKGSGYWQTQMADYQRRVQFAEAALCGVLRALEQSGAVYRILSTFDEKTAGVSVKQLAGWWRDHKYRDSAQ